tara:strand:+ start:370 stop:1482 length:1113 start_codon:yes stop_codon:yes gene_type:complete
MKVLVTGGAGFIGSYICEQLLDSDHEVYVLDNLDPQIHGANASWPDYMPDGTINYIGDIRDRELLKKILPKVDSIIHLAAAVGVGQSMYKIEHYCSTSVLGTAILLEEVLGVRENIKKIIVASSMSVYGEGAYKNNNEEIIYPDSRSIEQLKIKKWEMLSNNKELEPIPVKESKPLKPDSIYAINKRDQEEMCLTFGKAYDIPTVAFRMFNVYGARQALSNPYTGVIAIFCNNLLNEESPVIFEDGHQLRDFIHVNDVARAYVMALESSGLDGLSVNLGSGKKITINRIAKLLINILDKKVSPIIEGKYRAGDIRHCFADINSIQTNLGWSPKIKFDKGLSGLVEWLKTQSLTGKKVSSVNELEEFGLLK